MLPAMPTLLGASRRWVLRSMLLGFVVLGGVLMTAQPALATPAASATATANQDGTITVTINNQSTSGESLNSVHGDLKTGSPTVTNVTSSPPCPWSPGKDEGQPANVFDGAPGLPAGSTMTVTIMTDPPGYTGKIDFSFTFSGGGTIQINDVQVQSGGSTGGGGGSTGGGGGSTGGGGTGGPGYELKVALSEQQASQLGSRIVMSVTVAKSGDGPSPATKLQITRANPAADNFLLSHGNGTPAAEQTVDVPATRGGLPRAFQFDFTAVPFIAEPGSPAFQAAILGDGDADDDSPAPAGDDVSTGTTQVELTGASRAASPCAGASGASASAATCTIPRGRATAFGGTASGDVQHVQIAVESAGRGAHAARAKRQCSALAGPSGRLAASRAANGVCTTLRWLTVKGTKHWHYKLRKSLPPGRYVLYTRPVTSIGTPETGFTAARHNRLAFKVR